MPRPAGADALGGGFGKRDQPAFQADAQIVQPAQGREQPRDFFLNFAVVRNDDGLAEREIRDRARPALAAPALWSDGVRDQVDQQGFQRRLVRRTHLRGPAGVQVDDARGGGGKSNRRDQVGHREHPRLQLVRRTRGDSWRRFGFVGVHANDPRRQHHVLALFGVAVAQLHDDRLTGFHADDVFNLARRKNALGCVGLPEW